MRTLVTPGPTDAEYRAAIALATRAPSLHNTQPWAWRVTDGGLELRADRSRALPATDPDGHGLLLGCGAALALAELWLRARGWRCAVERLPDPADPDLLARLCPTGRVRPGSRDVRRVDAAVRRRSERRPFRAQPVPAEVLDDLCRAVGDAGVAAGPGSWAGEGTGDGGTYLHVVRRTGERLDLAVAASWADRSEERDREVAAELRRWVRADDSAPDGVPAGAYPTLAGTRHADVPLRDFGRSGVPGGQPVTGPTDEQPALAVLFTTTDGRAARLRAGEALGRLLVRATELGLAASLVSQPVDQPGTRARVRTLMSWVDHPQMLVRLGWPPAAPPALRTRRRRVEEITTVHRTGTSH